MSDVKRYEFNHLGSEHKFVREIDYATLQAERDRLRKQLPDEMQHCTIRFKECKLGHGSLTATNWVQHECQTCKIAALEKRCNELEKENAKLRECIKELCTNYESVHDDAKFPCPGRPLCKWLNQIDAALALLGERKEGE